MTSIHFCLIFRSTQKRGESFGISRIGSKIKGVFKSTTMEGAMLPNYGLAEGEDDFVSKNSSIRCMYNFRLNNCIRNVICSLIIFPFPDLLITLYYLFFH